MFELGSAKQQQDALQAMEIALATTMRRQNVTHITVDAEEFAEQEPAALRIQITEKNIIITLEPDIPELLEGQIYARP